MKKLLTTTALIFAATAAPAAAVDRGVITATGTLNTGQSFSCSWTEAPEGDCLGLTGDAKEQITLLERYGATSADFETTVTFGGKFLHSGVSAVQKRTDGTWLMTSRDQRTGQQRGHVCAGEPVVCVKWQAGTASTKAKATRKAKAAARG